MTTNYEEEIPNGILFNLREIENMHLIKIDMSKKLITTNKIESVKVGTKTHIARSELIRFLKENTISKEVRTNEEP